jgi:putative SOS response-associated peptidase YedK
VYRAEVPDQGVRDEDLAEAIDAREGGEQESGGVGGETAESPRKKHKTTKDTSRLQSGRATSKKDYAYELKVMKWGLIPFWTKRSPDYGSMLRTINCRDDSLIENRGMWTTMKQRKRCIVIAQGFYEWLKKGPGGKERVPHFVKRKDGQLMCMAGLWDCVRYEDVKEDENGEEKLYSYTIITTDANKQLRFLHDRMPVILDAGSEAMKIWLDPERNKWSVELQGLLKPYEGELECYPVAKEVGKVGNNSPDFIVPIDSKENKKNIANFFGNAGRSPQKKKVGEEVKVEREEEERRETKDHDVGENNAPLPVTADDGEKVSAKRKHGDEDEKKEAKAAKAEASPAKGPSKATKAGRKTRSAVSNERSTLKTSPVKMAERGSQRITNFFGK